MLNQKPNIFIIHGAYGYPEENWFPWLRKKMRERGVACDNPAFPTPQGQSLTSWMNLFDQNYAHFIHTNTILIGHSLGALFCLRWLEKNNVKVDSVILVGAFMRKLGIDQFDQINTDFTKGPFDWPSIICKSNTFICYHSDNDPYVPRWHFDVIANQLNAKKIIVSQAGHFNTQSGYTLFPHLYFYLKDEVARRIDSTTKS